MMGSCWLDSDQQFSFKYFLEKCSDPKCIKLVHIIFIIIIILIFIVITITFIIIIIVIIIIIIIIIMYNMAMMLHKQKDKQNYLPSFFLGHIYLCIIGHLGSLFFFGRFVAVLFFLTVLAAITVIFLRALQLSHDGIVGEGREVGPDELGRGHDRRTVLQYKSNVNLSDTLFNIYRQIC